MGLEEDAIFDRTDGMLRVAFLLALLLIGDADPRPYVFTG
jgi:hypothetical protein